MQPHETAEVGKLCTAAIAKVRVDLIDAFVGLR